MENYFLYTRYTNNGEESHRLAPAKINSFLQEQKSLFASKLVSVEAFYVPSAPIDHSLILVVQATDKPTIFKFGANVADLTKVETRFRECFTPDGMLEMFE